MKNRPAPPPYPPFRMLGTFMFGRVGYCVLCRSHTRAKKWFGPMFCINTQECGLEQPPAKLK